MNIIIRKEEIKDYNQIANINYEAFHNWKKDNPFVKEPLMVDVLRHNSLYDPELSLVAELHGSIIGHVLLSPFVFTMKGERIKAVILGPISVKPSLQKTGVGGLLINKAHEIAKEKNYQLSLLCGHPEYYPRYGYKNSMFALSGCKVSSKLEGFDSALFTERPVETEDLDWIIKSWKSVHADDLLAVFPGKTIIDWANHGTPCRSSVVMKAGNPIGFVRYQTDDSITIKEILGYNEDISDIINYMIIKIDKKDSFVEISLPFEKLASILKSEGNFKIEDKWASYDAFMIKTLNESSAAAEYCRKVETGEIKAALISLPPIYDIEEC